MQRETFAGESVPAADRPGLRRMQQIIAVAEGQKRYLVDYEDLPPEKVNVIYNGVLPQSLLNPTLEEDHRSIRKELGLEDSHRVATIVAHLRPEKNHRRFLRIAREVAKRLPEARFVVVGDGPERPALDSYARSLRIEGRVQFIGVRRDIPRVMAASDVIYFDHRAETFPMALLEGWRRPGLSLLRALEP